MAVEIAAGSGFFNNAAPHAPEIMPPMKSAFTPHPGQWRHAQTLWRDYLAEPNLPQLDRWLRARLARNKQFGKRDRLIYADILFAAARYGYFAAWILTRDNKADTENANAEALQQFASGTDNVNSLRRIFDELCADDNPEFLTLCYWRSTNDQTPPDVDATQRANIDAVRTLAQQQPESPWSLLWHGIPLAHIARIHQRAELSHWSKQHIAQFLQAQDQRPPLWLRCNHTSERNDVLQELREHYSEMERHVAEQNDAISIDGDKGIFDLESYKQGSIAIQDLASQQLAARIACKPGEHVWDACAGGGGKTLAIAARLANKGSVWASDIRTHKLEEIKRRAKLSRFYNIRTVPWAGDAQLTPPKEIARNGGFDWVLVDAPCSSSGTWRRNPDAKLRMLDDDLAQLTNLQLQLLSQASCNVKASGKLVYGTCSFDVIENENIVERFLASHPQWHCIEQTLLGCPDQDSDTMFVAVLAQKTAENIPQKDS